MKSFDRKKLKKGLKKKIVELYGVLHPAKEDFDIYKNALDGFSVFTEALLRGISLEDQMRLEKFRQIQKSAQNIISSFHVLAMTSVPGVKAYPNNPPSGQDKMKKPIERVDIISCDEKIIAKIKNKHNTVWGNERCNVHKTLVKLSNRHPDYICYFVEVLPKNAKSYDKIFAPPNRETGRSVEKNERVRQIDGKSFYKYLTGDDDALKELYNNLPGIINEIVNEEKEMLPDPVKLDFVKSDVEKIDFNKIINSELFNENFKMSYDSEFFARRKKLAKSQKNKITLKNKSV